ncbi:Presenilin-domain-containing protein [Entophlyctis helioformis]|nr:Presenilin-domain-containing protein [Entophlyctis helioformis]
MEDIKYSILQIFTIIKPVVICILLSVLWVKLSNPVEPLYDSRAPVFAAPSSVSVGTAFGTKGDGSDGTSVITALIILGQIVVATVVIACLFRYNQIKVIYGIFIFVVMLLLGYFGYVLGATLLSIAALSLDWITFVFFLWNLVAVGLAVIFWRGPMIIQQGYLVVMSSMMAFSLSTLPDLVTWILLGLLAVWDLIAVLCPFGPLRMLIESTGNGRDIPAALIYNAPMSMMASPGSLPSTRLPTLEPEPPRLEADIYVARASPQVQNAHLQQQPFAGQAFHGTTHDASQRGNSFYSSMDGPGAAQSDRSGGIELRPVLGRATSDHRPGSWDPQRPSRDPELPEPEAAAGQDVVEEDDNGVRLGLGDFVFYSVLVGRASLFDWITTVSTIVAVLAGLSMTIFLLGIYRKALPALPISIAFGIVFYLFSSTMLMPFTNNLTDLPMPLVVKVGDPSGLWVGKTGGGGMIFI